jgi:hypothetical protein
VEPATPAYSCTCPSRKFPCKHVLGLLLLWAEGPTRGVPDTDTPADWVTTWLTARQTRQTTATARAAARATTGPADPAAAARRAAARAQRVAAGVADLDRRLADRLRSGLAGEGESGAASAWEDVAKRMVDAQAPGLASRVRELTAVPASGEGWPSRLLEEYGLLHLLGSGFSRLDELPEALAATIRTRVGFTVPKDEVLKGPILRDTWQVLGRQDTLGEKDLTTRKVWLRGQRSRRPALLLAFARPGRAPELTLSAGLQLDADLAHYPGARPLRAELGTQHGPTRNGAARPEGSGIRAALDEYTDALAEEPWLDAWPVVLQNVIPIPAGGGWLLADAEAGPAAAAGAAGGAAGGGGAGRPDSLPLPRGFVGSPGLWRLIALSAGHPITVFGECGHHGFTPITAWGDHAEEADHPADLASTDVAATIT